ncbi:MAG: hypothetical protein WC295_07525 [Methanoregula sp.]|jgi:hypothetical protein
MTSIQPITPTTPLSCVSRECEESDGNLAHPKWVASSGTPLSANDDPDRVCPRVKFIQPHPTPHTSSGKAVKKWAF